MGMGGQLRSARHGGVGEDIDGPGLLDVAVEAAEAAGGLLLDGLGRARHVSTKSSATDMVSEMDRRAETLVRSILANRRPGDAVLGEEGGQSGAPPNGGATGIRWIVDPLDGTTNYLYGFPAWCVSVAAERDGTVRAGAVFDPVHGELWTAVAGRGAACNGVALGRLVGSKELATSLVATGFSYSAERRAAQGVVAARVLPSVRDLRRAGSAALDLCWVAAGRVDAYFEEGTRIWDRAAGGLVAGEVGAWVGGIDGGPPSDDGVLAAHPAIARPLRELIAGAVSSAART